MIKIPIDPINPGHIFAAVGLIELASRLTGEAKGHFDPLCFHLSLREDWNIAKLINEIQRLELNSTDSTNKDAPLYLGKLRLDWWFRPSANDSSAGNLKTWAAT